MTKKMCYLCGQRVIHPSKEHILPKSFCRDVGLDPGTLGNLTVTCRLCNSSKGSELHFPYCDDYFRYFPLYDLHNYAAFLYNNRNSIRNTLKRQYRYVLLRQFEKFIIEYENMEDIYNEQNLVCS